MKLVTFAVDDYETYGVVNGDGVVDLGSRVPQGSVLDLLRSDALGSIEKFINYPADYSLDDIHYRVPVSGGEKILCIGINYPDREEEYKGSTRRGQYPNLFVKFPSTFSAHNESIVRPKVSEQFDYEGEVAIVIGKEARHVSIDNALDHIAGFIAGNEGSVRDWLNHSSRNVTQGKNFLNSSSLGPWMVTSDEMDPRSYYDITTRVNGEERQHDSTKNMFWYFDELISYISIFTKLLPGDIIFTGTPTGAGIHRDPPIFLKPGDILEVEVEGIGVLRNSVVDET